MSKWSEARGFAINEIALMKNYIELDCVKDDVAELDFARTYIRRFGLFLEALDIAERFDSAQNRDSVDIILNSACDIICGDNGCSEGYKEMYAREGSCGEANAFYEGYQQALDDVRGETDEIETTCETCKHYEPKTERTGICRHLGFGNTYDFYCGDYERGGADETD